MVSLYEIFIEKNLRFQIRNFALNLRDYLDIYPHYNSPCDSGFLSDLVYGLNSYNFWLGI